MEICIKDEEQDLNQGNLVQILFFTKYVLLLSSFQALCIFMLCIFLFLHLLGLFVCLFVCDTRDQIQGLTHC
jgi:hypothetical protein